LMVESMLSRQSNAINYSTINQYFKKKTGKILFVSDAMTVHLSVKLSRPEKTIQVSK